MFLVQLLAGGLALLGVGRWLLTPKMPDHPPRVYWHTPTPLASEDDPSDLAVLETELGESLNNGPSWREGAFEDHKQNLVRLSRILNAEPGPEIDQAKASIRLFLGGESALRRRLEMGPEEPLSVAHYQEAIQRVLDQQKALEQGAFLKAPPAVFQSSLWKELEATAPFFNIEVTNEAKVRRPNAQYYAELARILETGSASQRRAAKDVLCVRLALERASLSDSDARKAALEKKASLLAAEEAIRHNRTGSARTNPPPKQRVFAVQITKPRWNGKALPAELRLFEFDRLHRFLKTTVAYRPLDRVLTSEVSTAALMDHLWALNLPAGAPVARKGQDGRFSRYTFRHLLLYLRGEEVVVGYVLEDSRGERFVFGWEEVFPLDHCGNVLWLYGRQRS